MDRITFIIAVLAVYMLYMAFKHRNTFKKLSVAQNIGVLLTFLAAIAIFGSMFYYGVNYFAELSSSWVVDLIIQIVFAFFIMIGGVVAFSAVVYKITNGLLPVPRDRE
ncbi:hypothetical protein [Virgibacillus siamensis]|uniref:hypothetical protein n=1 Tax=Virgibacillus siamensis TaxID=480071 RepID=UPI000987B61C|nr:hypothetical protein [Virgibacillus siamensis]